jgi:hypothetical protein
MKMILTREEEFICHEAAIALAKKNTDYWQTREGSYTKDKTLHDLIAQDAQSIGSEWVVAKYLGLSFNPYEQKGKHKADVGSHFEVRWTKYVAGQLIIHEYDRTDDVAILVTGESPHYFIAGWIPIAMAKRPKYRHTKQPNWWVTQINLQPIENLRRSNYGNRPV